MREENKEKEMIYIFGRGPYFEHLIEFAQKNRYPIEVYTDPIKDIEVVPGGIGMSISTPWIFKKDFIDKFEGQLYNLHATRLPMGRGGAGQTWRILGQERFTEKFGGATIHKIDEGIDTGDIVAQTEFLYPDTCTVPQDYLDYEFPIVSKFLTEFISHGGYEGKPQDNAQSEYYPKDFGRPEKTYQGIS